MQKLQKVIKSIIYSDVYLLVLALSTFLVWHFQLDVMGMSAFAIIFMLVMIFMDDAVAAVPPILWLMLMISQKHEVDFIESNMTLFICLIAGALVSVAVFFLRNKVKFRLGKQFWGFLALSVALLLGGIFYDPLLVLKSLPSTLSLAGCMLVVYLIFNNVIKSANPKYFAKIMAYTGVILFLQTLTFYLTSSYDITTLINFKLLDLGWGVSNSIGFLLLLTIPFTLYLVMKSKMPVIYMLLSFCQIFTLILTLSRGSILMALLGLPILLVYVCVRAENKKLVIGTLVYSVVLFFVFVGIFWKEITLILERITVTSSNGRMELYGQAINDFLKSPISGISMLGRDPSVNANIFKVHWYHCTLLQYAANAGIIGVGAYIFHLVLKYKMFLLPSDAINKFIFVAILMWSGYAMIDIGYFIEYQLIFFVLTLVFAEKNVYNNKIE